MDNNLDGKSFIEQLTSILDKDSIKEHDSNFSGKHFIKRIEIDENGKERIIYSNLLYDQTSN